MRPHVIVHNGISLNGMLTGFDVEMGLYYDLAGKLGCEADLVGSGTILAAPEAAQADDPLETCAPQEGPGSILVVPDSRGRVKCWGFLQRSGFWGRFVSLASEKTPADHIAYLRQRGVEVIRAGGDRVDLAAALEELGQRFGVARVRTDSGGTLNGALLELGLVDEVSALVFPVVVTGPARVPFFTAVADGRFGLALTHEERFEGGEVWLRYDVVR
jgi:2,5-diamino-6-(ribosylamino)-4(3H)-pyrimidinone 5'-phosphate reductase